MNEVLSVNHNRCINQMSNLWVNCLVITPPWSPASNSLIAANITTIAYVVYCIIGSLSTLISSMTPPPPFPTDAMALWIHTN